MFSYTQPFFKSLESTQHLSPFGYEGSVQILCHSYPAEGRVQMSRHQDRNGSVEFCPWSNSCHCVASQPFCFLLLIKFIPSLSLTSSHSFLLLLFTRTLSFLLYFSSFFLFFISLFLVVENHTRFLLSNWNFSPLPFLLSFLSFTLLLSSTISSSSMTFLSSFFLSSLLTYLTYFCISSFLPSWLLQYAPPTVHGGSSEEPVRRKAQSKANRNWMNDLAGQQEFLLLLVF